MEELSDPFLDDRVMKNVLPSPRFPMAHQKLFPKKKINPIGRRLNPI